jgi:hypothetical protein
VMISPRRFSIGVVGYSIDGLEFVWVLLLVVVWVFDVIP